MKFFSLTFLCVLFFIEISEIYGLQKESFPCWCYEVNCDDLCDECYLHVDCEASRCLGVRKVFNRLQQDGLNSFSNCRETLKMHDQNDSYSFYCYPFLVDHIKKNLIRRVYIGVFYYDSVMNHFKKYFKVDAPNKRISLEEWNSTLLKGDRYDDFLETIALCKDMEKKIYQDDLKRYDKVLKEGRIEDGFYIKCFKGWIKKRKDEHKLIEKTIEEVKEELYPLFFHLNRSCVSRHPSVLGYYEKGLLNFEKGNFIDCIKDAEKFTDFLNELDVEDEKVFKTRLQTGKAYIELGKYNQAIDVLSKLILENPKNKNAYFERAIAYFETGNFDLALQDYLVSGHKRKFSHINNIEYAKGLIFGMKQGIADGTKELIPSIFSSIKGSAHGLWATISDEKTGIHPFIDNPCNYFNRFMELSRLCWDDFSRHINQLAIEEGLENMTDIAKQWSERLPEEVIQFIRNYCLMDDLERGKKTGYIIGKYGADIFACLGSMKLIAKTRELLSVNRTLTMESCLPSSNYQLQVTRLALEKQAFRESFKKLPFTPKIVQGNKNYGLKHIMKRHSYETKARGVSRFAKRIGEKDIKSLINTAIKKDLGYFVEKNNIVMEVDLGRVIGLDQDGKVSSVLRVVIGDQGNVTTAYPI